MDERAEQMRQLKELGLSVCASRAYIALLELGVGEARSVSELASIPTAKVYGTLRQLQERGLAEVAVGKPRKYTPVPMEDFLDRQIDDGEERLDLLRERKPDLAALFPVQGTAEVIERSRLVSIAGRRNVLQRFRDASMATRKEIILRTTSELSSPDGVLGRLLRPARERGVHVEVHRADAPVLEGPEHVAIATFDTQSAIFMRVAPAPERRRREGAAAIFTSERAFVEPLRSLLALEGAREHGEPVDTRVRTLAV